MFVHGGIPSWFVEEIKHIFFRKQRKEIIRSGSLCQADYIPILAANCHSLSTVCFVKMSFSIPLLL